MSESLQQQLLYTIRFDVEGKPEIVTTTGDLDKQEKEVQRLNKEIEEYKKLLNDTGKQLPNTTKPTKDFNKANSSASNLLVELSRGASDAQYGIRGLGNNLEQAANIGAHAYRQFGSFGGLIKGVGASMLGPTGIVVGITAVTTGLGLLESGFFDSKEEMKDWSEQTDQVVSDISKIQKKISEINGITSSGFFNVEGDLEALRTLSGGLEEDVKDRLREIKELTDPKNLTQGQIRQATSEGRTNFDRYGNITSVDLATDQKEIKKYYESLAESIADEIELLENKIAQPDLLRPLQTIIDKELQESFLQGEKLLNDLDQKLQDFKIEDPESTEMDTFQTESLSEYKKYQEQQQREYAKNLETTYSERQRFESRLSSMRIAVARSTGDELKALEVEKQAKIEEIRNNELISERQRKEALELITQEYANRSVQIAQKEADEKKKLEKEVADEKYRFEQDVYDAKLNFASTLSSSLVGIGAVIVGESEKNAKRRFEIDKAASYSSAGVNTYLGVTKALASSPPPKNFIDASAVGIAGGLQIAKIAATKFGSSGSSNSAQSTSFRDFGSSTGEPSFSTPSGRNTPVETGRSTGINNSSLLKEVREIKIVDGFGNIVAKGQEELDTTGTNGYVRGGN
ncbi:MAG: hypothetical protein RLN90_09535 [Balneolaceae bacterium]